MANCPVCNASVKDDFGLVTCPSCGAQVLIDMDGVVPPQNEPAYVEQPENIDPSDVEVSQSEINSESAFPPVPSDSNVHSPIEPPTGVEPLSFGVVPPLPTEEINNRNDPQGSSFKDSEIPAPSFMGSLPSYPSSDMPSEIPLQSADEDQELAVKPKMVFRNPVAANSDMREIAQFGNSPESQGRDGMLRFKIEIAGIDSSDLKKLVKDALDDERFLWDVDQIIAKMKSGRIVISDVSAIKSTLLIQKLRVIPVEIRWEQYAIFQS